MALYVKNTIMKDLDIVDDEHGGVTLQPNFDSNAGVSGTGRQPTAKAVCSLLRISGVYSMKAITNVPVRIVFHQNTLVAIGHWSDDLWCYLPNGGDIISMKDIKTATNESEICTDF